MQMNCIRIQRHVNLMDPSEKQKKAIDFIRVFLDIKRRIPQATGDMSPFESTVIAKHREFKLLLRRWLGLMGKKLLYFGKKDPLDAKLMHAQTSKVGRHPLRGEYCIRDIGARHITHAIECIKVKVRKLPVKFEELWNRGVAGSVDHINVRMALRRVVLLTVGGIFGVCAE